MPGELVATHRKGREGVVIVGESKTAENAIDVIEGMQFEAWVRLRGIVSLIGQDQTLTFSS